MVQDKTRTDLLNFLAKKYSLHSYLEIGLQDRTKNFDKIKCVYKISVDPDPAAHAAHCMTSDEYFMEINRIKAQSHPKYKVAELFKFDLIFIDGLHTAEQVQKDFENALNILSPNGFIVLHDCNPLKEEHTIVPRPTKRGHWNGDVYKFATVMPKQSFYTVDIDNGMGVFQNIPDNGLNGGYLRQRCGWISFDPHRKELLNLISWDEFINSHSHV